MRYLGIIFIISFLFSCKKDKEDNSYHPTPYALPQISNFRIAELNPDNPLTEEGVRLGHQLFFEKRLSKDFTLSCASCHLPENGFSDPKQFSEGVGGTLGRRQSMSLYNLAWGKQFFWDGRAKNLEEQALFPVPDTTEMHLTWQEAEQRLNAHIGYKKMFKDAFGTDNITKELVARALAQYVKTIVSYNSPFDKYIRKEGNLSAAALRGYKLFNTEAADCFHCHSTPELFIHPSQVFSNNGLDVVDNPEGFKDKGHGEHTGNPQNNGQFKIPSLRNLTMTAPYMHDGRFKTLDEVIDFYNNGPNLSPSLDPIMITEANRRLLQDGRWGLGLSEQDKADLKAYLISLSDSTVLKNPLYQAPKEM
ncbi:MAG: cytochrome-c peroxidase [Chitinophagales bacterium]|nr:cytochrome-c peroxidase [Chitinophagales bacterium]